MANAETWEKKITEACKEAGTYEPFFEPAIKQLASIMEMRDNAERQFKASGGQPVVAHTNKAGATNIVKNPALAVINECNQQALAFWRELGLTPRGFKMINGEGAVKKKSDGFTEALAGIGL